MQLKNKIRWQNVAHEDKIQVKITKWSFKVNLTIR